MWQTSTVGAAAADRLRELATAHSRSMVDAPVSGTTVAAERGQLTWLVSGPGEAIEKARPVLDSLGTRMIVAGGAGGEPAQARRQRLDAVGCGRDGRRARGQRSVGCGPVDIPRRTAVR